MAKMHRLLFISHSFHNRAGTEEHIRTLLCGLKEDFECYVAFPHHGTVVLRDPSGEERSFPGAALPWPLTPLEEPHTLASLDTILKQVKPDLIHLHHLMNWPLGVLKSLVVWGKPLVVTFHDYYFITPHFTMQGVVSPKEVLKAPYSVGLFKKDLSDEFRTRHDFFRPLLEQAAICVAPSVYAAGAYQEIFPMHVEVIEHGIEAFETKPSPSWSGIRFGYVGSLIPQKGWQSLVHAFGRVASTHAEAELHLFGSGEIPPIRHSQIHFHGRFEPTQLPEVMNQFDIGVIPSLFPETFCLVLSELQMAELPVAASKIGALDARIKDSVTGRHFKPGAPDSIAETLEWFCFHEEWRSWEIPRPRLAQQMVSDYRTLYRDLVSRPAPN